MIDMRKFCAIISFFLSAFANANYPAFASGADKHILILDSHGAEAQALTPILNGFREGLSAHEGLRLSVEHLDLYDHLTDGRPDKDYVDKIKAAYARKYRDTQIDIIAPIGEPALEFVLSVREELFSSAPVVFGDLNSVSHEETPAIQNATGVLGSYAFEENIELILHQTPDLERIVIISGDAANSIWMKRSLLRATKTFEDRVQFETPPLMRMAELESFLTALTPGKNAVLFLSFEHDADGVYFDNPAALMRITQASGAPVYGPLEEMLGFGIVGGYLRSSEQLGEALAAVAAPVLDGVPPAAIPVIDETPHRYQFDYRQLQRFDISPRVLPRGSRIIEEPDTFYYRYRHLFWTAVAVLAALLIYISQLLYTIRRRLRAQQGLERLIAAGEQALSIDNAVSFAGDVVNRITTVIPSLRPLGLYHYAGASKSFDPAGLLPILECDKATPPRNQSNLLKDAFETGANRYTSRKAVIRFSDPRLPVSMALLRSGRRIDAIDQRLLDIASKTIEVEFANREATRLEDALKTASAIQSAMLPTDFEDLGAHYGLDIHALLRPAKEVGGDLYDVFAIDEDKLCVLVGDVSDKGVPAALFMAMTKSVIRAAAETIASPGQILSKANAVLEHGNRQAMFVTVFLGVYSRASGVFQYASAGHNPPLLRKGGRQFAQLTVANNIALAVMPEASFIEESITLSTNDSVMLYTDGVTEAANLEDEQFGEHRLEEMLNSSLLRTAKQMDEATLTQVDAFAGGAQQSDDITLLSLIKV